MSISQDYQKNILKQCFNDKNRFLHCVELVHSDRIFFDEDCQLIWKVFVMIYRKGENICMSTVRDVFKEIGCDDCIVALEEILAYEHPDENEWQYHLFYIQEQYRKKVLLEASQNTIRDIGKYNSKELSGKWHEILGELDSIDVTTVSFRNSYQSTLKNIRNIHDGNESTMLMTGKPNFDSKVSLSKSRYILVAAQKKIGKSRYMVDLIDDIISNNPGKVAIQWYSFEMPNEEICRCFISRKVRLTDKQMLSKNYKLSDFELGKIDAAMGFFEHYPIEFVDEPVDIFQITSKFERFTEMHAEKHCICIIDNLGLIKPHISDSNLFEDDVARSIKNLRDNTKGTIFLVHHLTKESESKWNKESGYEPKITHIRGSSRIVDFANQVLLLHRPDNYEDLVSVARVSGKEDQIRGLFIVDVAANRDGETGRIMMKHELQYCIFKEKT